MEDLSISTVVRECWGGGPVGKALAAQPWRPGFGSLRPTQKAGEAVHTCNQISVASLAESVSAKFSERWRFEN